MTRANALINQVWLVSSDQVGLSSQSRARGGKGGCYGHSRIINPVGKIIDEIGYEEGLAIATVDIEGGITEAKSSTYHGLNNTEYLYPECHIPLFRRKPN